MEIKEIRAYVAIDKEKKRIMELTSHKNIDTDEIVYLGSSAFPIDGMGMVPFQFPIEAEGPKEAFEGYEEAEKKARPIAMKRARDEILKQGRSVVTPQEHAQQVGAAANMGMPRAVPRG